MSKPAASGTAGAASAPVGGEVVKTGREVDGIVLSLLKHANDADESVRAQMAFAVQNIGVAQPLLAVSSLGVFLARNTKLEQPHRVVLLKMLAQLLETQTARDAVGAAQQSEVKAESELAANLVKYLAKEMTAALVSADELKVTQACAHRRGSAHTLLAASLC